LAELRRLRVGLTTSTAFLLVLSIVSAAALAKSGRYFAPSNLAQRVLRLNPMAEPIGEEAGEQALEIQPDTREAHSTVVAEAPGYIAPAGLRRSLTLLRSSTPLRSPPLPC
jgi:hypothetical protein